MPDAKRIPSEKQKVDRAVADLRRAEHEMLRHALLDLQKAELQYVERYEAWIHGERAEQDARLFHLQEAERRVDEARQAATQWDAARRGRLD